MSWFAEISKPVRHRLVKRLAPKLYSIAISPEAGILLPRPMTVFMKQHFRSRIPLVGVEIGVASGLNARSFMKFLNMHHLYLVDPWIPYFEHAKRRIYYVTSAWDRLEKARENLAPWSNQVTFIKKTSDEAVSWIPNVDFVYIDGNHDHEYVLRDLKNYYPKIRSGGVLGGHDFRLPQYEGVVNAVAEFAVEYDLTIQGALIDFWMVKP